MKKSENIKNTHSDNDEFEILDIINGEIIDMNEKDNYIPLNSEDKKQWPLNIYSKRIATIASVFIAFTTAVTIIVNYFIKKN